MIRVHVLKYKDRPNLVMRYTDPLTGNQVAVGAGTSDWPAARLMAAQWERELNLEMDGSERWVAQAIGLTRFAARRDRALALLQIIL